MRVRDLSFGRRLSASTVVLCLVVGLPGAASAVTPAAFAPVPGSPFAAGDGPSSVAFSPSGALVAVTNRNTSTISMYTVSANGTLTPVPGSPFPTGAFPRDVAFSPDGTVLATANFTGHSVSTFTVAANGVLTPADTESTGGDVAQLAFSPNGQFLAAPDNLNDRVFVWSVAADGTLTAVPGSPFVTGGSNPSSVAWSPSGTFLAVGDNLSNNVRMYSVAANGALTLAAGPFTTPSSPVDVAFRPDGTLLAVASSSGSVSTFTVSPGGTLALVATVPRPAPRSVEFNFDGTLLATSSAPGNVVSVDSVSAGGVLTPLPGSPYLTGGDNSGDASFSPDGLLLATANFNTDNVSVLAGVLPFRNGSFETPDVTVGNRFFPTNSSIGAWVVTAGDVDVVRSSDFKASEGSQSLDLNGTTPGTVCQTFATTPGKTYDLNFMMSRNGFGTSSASLEVTVDGGAPTAFTHNAPGWTTTNPQWQPHTVTFTADGDGSSTVCFKSTAPASGGTGPVIDAVRLCPCAPLPATVSGNVWTLSSSTGAPVTTFTFGTRPLVPIVGDWDGNGTRTPGVYEAGTFKLLNTAAPVGGPDITFAFGYPRGFPVVGDWNGDGYDDVAVYFNGVWQTRLTPTATTPATENLFPFGSGTFPATVPVAGDWNGDGVDGIGTYDYASGLWSLRNTASPGLPDAGSFRYQPVPNSFPVVGDWDQDGDDTVGVKAGTQWLLNYENDPSAPDRVITSGGPNDFPLVWSSLA